MLVFYAFNNKISFVRSILSGLTRSFYPFKVKSLDDPEIKTKKRVNYQSLAGSNSLKKSNPLINNLVFVKKIKFKGLNVIKQ